MKQLRCPINGLRPIQEFSYGGDVRDMPDPDQSTDSQWADYVLNRGGEPGMKREWWYHTPSGTWLIAERDIQTDHFLRTYLYERQQGLEADHG